MSRDSQFIDGIFNYCDRWCERCPMTSRCRVYAMEQEMTQPRARAEAENELFWQGIEDHLEKSLEEYEPPGELIDGDLDLDEPSDEELEEIQREQEWRRKITASQDLAVVTHEYADAVDRWFKKHGSDLEKSPTRTTRELKPDVSDAAAVISWYQYQIHVKSLRALNGHLDEDFGDDPRQSDWNGSAKVALLGIERSMSAWSLLRDLLPGRKDSIVEMLRRCGWMRRLLLDRFADARSFVRPGFDDP
jgi:hypothetical protein